MIGSKLAHYQITAHLGSGGFGDVYQATDSKLGRSVALKFLPEAFARDAERVARFQREARVLASLNHPNIAAIYGFEESGGRNFLVMEFVPGEALAERIKRGPIPVEGALGMAAQIAEALEAAHESEKEIIHRDLKLANVKITPDGKVKVLDFGLAKALEPDPADVSLSNSPTLSAAATNAGVILGTAAYMSPEQAKGMTVDRRTDIFAFGSVLYEMLTARQAFQGATVGDILAAVIRAEPDWKCLPVSVPFRVRELLRLCLQKDAKKRRQTAADVRIDIEQALAEPVAAMPAAMPTRGTRMGWVVAAAAVLVAVVLAIPAFRYLRETPLPEMRTEIITPATTNPASFSLSPDGLQLVFIAPGNGGRQQLWLRGLDSTTAQPLVGTDGARGQPVWSPDSRSISFFADGKLKRIDIKGGLLQVLANANTGIALGTARGAWSPDGVILFPNSSALFSVPASGGEAVARTKRDSGITGHNSPAFLPGGRKFLFFADGAEEVSGLYLGSLDSTDTRRITTADTTGVYLLAGWLLFVRQQTLVAQRFDVSRGELIGDPLALADSVGSFAVSATGLIAYRKGEGSRQLTWFDRSGKALGTVGAADNTPNTPELSPDGSRVAVERNGDIWLLDGERTVRFTLDPAQDNLPIWSPDGSRIVFRSNRNDPNQLFQKPSSGGATEEVFLEKGGIPSDWSRDGRYFLYNDATGTDLWALPLQGDRKPFVFVNTKFIERSGKFSPDGRWVAYQSAESGRNEIYIRTFPGPGGQWQISTSGGVQPRWRADGNELYYISPDGKLMAAPIAVTGTTLKPGAPITLFQTRIFEGGASIRRQQYDVAPDGRFLINTVLEDAASPITLVQNWKPPAN